MRMWPWNARVTEIACVALGGNLGDRLAFLAAARTALTLLPGVRLIAASRVEETAPLGSSRQAPYLNQMVALATSLSPNALLVRLQAIEQRLGRVRATHWGSRTIDLDIVRFGSRRMSNPWLTVPHPGLADRDFWQRELAELQPLIAAAS